MKNWIDNLSLRGKFGLLGAIAALMLAVPTGVVLRDGLAELQHAQQEATGLAPAQAALRWMQLTQQHRGLSAGVLGGNTSMAAPRQAKQAEVEQALAQARQQAATLADSRLLEQADRLAVEWQALAAAVAGRALAGPESFARHTALVAAQIDWLEDIAQASGIAMHPQAAGFHLQSGVLAQLPPLTEALGQMRARGALALNKGEASPEERARIEALATRARGQLQRVQKDLTLAGAADATLQQTLAAPLAAAVDAARASLKLADEQVVRADRLTLPAGDFFAALTRDIDAQFALVDVALQALDSRLQDSVSTVRWQLGWLWGLLAALGALALALMWRVARHTGRSLEQALRLAESAARGDLSTEICAGGRDEVGRLLQALATMNRQLAGVVADVRRNAEGVATASTQIAQGNNDLASRTEQQAAALEQTAASMEQLGATVRHNASHAGQADQLAQGATLVARKGGQVVGQAVAAMKDIHQSSRQIAEITAVIDGIAFQTNILALNASVEAARAGEQGRGFAVVASEVRTLAQRAATAARQIRGLVTASVERVEQGTRLVDEAGATMHEVVGAIDRVTALMGQISLASGEQSAGVAQVGDAVSQMDRATQQNAALVEEAAAAAESLQRQAGQLVQAVAVFKLSPVA